MLQNTRVAAFLVSELLRENQQAVKLPPLPPSCPPLPPPRLELKVKTVKTRKYGREAMINNSISSKNNIQKIILSHVLCDLSYSKLKSLLAKRFLKSSNND